MSLQTRSGLEDCVVPNLRNAPAEAAPPKPWICLSDACLVSRPGGWPGAGDRSRGPLRRAACRVMRRLAGCCWVH